MRVWEIETGGAQQDGHQIGENGTKRELQRAVEGCPLIFSFLSFFGLFLQHTKVPWARDPT